MMQTKILFLEINSRMKSIRMTRPNIEEIGILVSIFDLQPMFACDGIWRIRVLTHS